MIYPRAILIETTNTHIYIYWNDDTSIAAKNIGNLKWVCLKMKYSIASPTRLERQLFSISVGFYFATFTSIGVSAMTVKPEDWEVSGSPA